MNKFEWNKDLFNHADNVELRALMKINKLIELYKIKYKDKIVNNIKRSNLKTGGYFIDEELLGEISQNLFIGIDELNLMVFEDVAEYYYKKAVKIVKDLINEEVEEKYDKKNVKKYLKTIIIGEGINYDYVHEFAKRMEYFNSKMATSSMAVITKRIQSLSEEYVSNNYKESIKSSLNMNDDIMNENMRGQKKQLANFIDNTMIFVATSSMIQAYIDLGITKVIRVAEIDERTCKLCDSLDGKIYPIDKITDGVPSHRSCRCQLYPIID